MTSNCEESDRDIEELDRDFDGSQHHISDVDTDEATLASAPTLKPPRWQGSEEGQGHSRRKEYQGQGTRWQKNNPIK